MPFSTASSSACRRLALLSLAASSTLASALRSSNDDGIAAPGTGPLRMPIRLPPLASEECRDRDAGSSRNASACAGAHFAEDGLFATVEEEGNVTLLEHSEARYVENGRVEEGGWDERDYERELPEELAAMIAHARTTSGTAAAPPAAPKTPSAIRYYPTYDEDRPCSSKSSASFEAWEESFETLEGCCDVHFGWDYDACVGGNFRTL